jgi:hypothetical protein
VKRAAGAALYGSTMDKQPIDQAVKLAAVRTIEAQDRVVEEIEERHAPDPSTTAVVVHRAEDVEVLAEEAAGRDPASEVDPGR